MVEVSGLKVWAYLVVEAFSRSQYQSMRMENLKINYQSNTQALMEGNEANMAKILIAEDERDIRDLITFTLRFAGHEVITAVNGEEAYNLSIEAIPDLILMDVRMPKMTGYEACKALKENSLTENIPVVFLSAKGQEAEVQTGIEAGAVEYILKPFSPDQLAERVQAILKKHSS
jgi:DNA-binding response OmpR family regulator